MPRLPRWARTTSSAVLVAVLGCALGACGQGSRSDAEAAAEAKATRALKLCRAQWHDVGDSVTGMDQDPNPSALASRWTSVIATVQYYETAPSAKSCQTAVETQLKAITALRDFADKLRPYDMTYPLEQVRASIDLYLSDPLPAPVRGQDGKRVQPPAKSAVAAAMKTLTDNAAEANAELQPGWEQTTSVDLSDDAALTKVMKDLDFLAQDSPHWRQCETALQVLVAATRAQDGLAPGSSTPSSSPTDATAPAG